MVENIAGRNGKPDTEGCDDESSRPDTGPDAAASNRATQIALCLRDWLARNPEVRSLKNLSAMSNVSYSTLKKIAAAQRGPSQDTLRKLTELGGVESLRQWLDVTAEPLQERLAHPAGIPETTRPTPSDSGIATGARSPSEQSRHDQRDLPKGGKTPRANGTPGDDLERSKNEESVRRIVGTLYSLKEQLEFLKGDNEEGRELFRKYMSKRDAAYVFALLQALFSEDEFQRWVLFSEYRSTGAKR